MVSNSKDFEKLAPDGRLDVLLWHCGHFSLKHQLNQRINFKFRSIGLKHFMELIQYNLLVELRLLQAVSILIILIHRLQSHSITGGRKKVWMAALVFLRAKPIFSSVAFGHFLLGDVEIKVDLA